MSKVTTFHDSGCACNDCGGASLAGMTHAAARTFEVIAWLGSRRISVLGFQCAHGFQLGNVNVWIHADHWEACASHIESLNNAPEFLRGISLKKAGSFDD